MITSRKVKLSQRPDAEEMCIMGCGNHAKEGSLYCSTDCRMKFHAQQKNIRLAAQQEQQERHVAMDTRTWEERWNDIYAKYGVNKDIKPNRHLEA